MGISIQRSHLQYCLEDMNRSHGLGSSHFLKGRHSIILFLGWARLSLVYCSLCVYYVCGIPFASMFSCHWLLYLSVLASTCTLLKCTFLPFNILHNVLATSVFIDSVFPSAKYRPSLQLVKIWPGNYPAEEIIVVEEQSVKYKFLSTNANISWTLPITKYFVTSWKRANTLHGRNESFLLIFTLFKSNNLPPPAEKYLYWFSDTNNCLRQCENTFTHR